MIRWILNLFRDRKPKEETVQIRLTQDDVNEIIDDWVSKQFGGIQVEWDWDENGDEDHDVAIDVPMKSFQRLVSALRNERLAAAVKEAATEGISLEKATP